LYGIVSSAAKQKTLRTVDRTMAGGNTSRASDNDDSSSSSSDGAVMAAAAVSASRCLTSETEEEDDSDVLRNSPERMMALSIHQQDIHPKLHQLIDRILSELERLQSKISTISNFNSIYY
jgi:hypothetical protein